MGYRVLILDNRDQHESAHSARDGAYEARSLALDVIDLVKGFGFVKPNLFGHSFGGLISQRAVFESPDTFSSPTLFCSSPDVIPGKSELQASFEILAGMSMRESWDRLKTRQISC